MKEQFWSKVLLFGEYSMIFDSTALLIPLKLFSAKWACAKEENEPAAVFSRRELSLFCDFLQASDSLKEVIDTEINQVKATGLNCYKYVFHNCFLLFLAILISIPNI